MPLCEHINSLICSPTEKCCQKLCRKRKRETDDNEEYHSTLKTLLDKMTCSTRSKKLLKERKPTGWVPSKDRKINEESEPSYDDFTENKWEKKKHVVYPLVITSTATFNEQSDVNNPFQSVWAKNDATVFSAMTTTSNAKPSQYWVKSNLQYVVVLPVDERHRSSPPRPTMSNNVSVDDKPRSITEKTSYDDDETPSITKKTTYENDETPPITVKTVSDDEERHPKKTTFYDDLQKPSKKETFDSEDFDLDSESEDSFEPRSNAKPSKKKGGCCGGKKRQDSDDS